MLLLTGYSSKKELKECVGQPLKYQETSFHGIEYKPTGKVVAAHRPAMGVFKSGREFFAEIEMFNGVIHKVS
jgi:hypothetical protein